MNFINNKVFDDLLAENYSIDSNRQFDYTFLWLENDNYLINLYAKLLNYLVLQKYNTLLQNFQMDSRPQENYFLRKEQHCRVFY